MTEAIAAIADTAVILIIAGVWITVGFVLVNRLSGFPKEPRL